MQGTPPLYHAITLVVTNSERLDGRSMSSHVFHAEGGFIGSGREDHWLLQDRHGQILPAHAEIRLFDERFCLIDCSGQTFVNHATLPIGQNRQVALRDGDELLIGDYRLRVHYGDRQAVQPGSQPLDTLITEENEMPEGAELPAMEIGKHRHDDPLDALDDTTTHIVCRDPLDALAPSDASTNDGNARAALATRFTSSAIQGVGDDLRDRSQTAMRLPTIRRHEEPPMDETILNDLERSVGEQLEERWQDPTTTGASVTNHVGTAPLLRALGGKLSFRDSEEQHAFLEEAGHTLRATIEGLLSLHREQDNNRYPLRDRHLQPIEDNPLRLDQDYDETLNTLFSARRSPVHLSAPAAIGECLEHQRQHQTAIEEAIGQALSSILEAFSPDALLKRFHAYRRSQRIQQDESGWAWDMYCHYYQELDSGRQRGFEKLFWEVFEQAYDSSVRRQQRENA
ncbi:FHA domain protein [Modicisalibacter ilicicola DSM 19980]|uniref:FHA domain protein n=1 Tax=Modicisalibacter ilicicola DSM 19980 TaxID=1121942 RepID=A0A1M5B2X5_9GAMM|nr:type VI secretion system-associated FHA domain protein TagH [Halomonas ilicicola]SHF36853.1 FHA domain protein [Halomonas ilicicola DSM 19980]